MAARERILHRLRSWSTAELAAGEASTPGAIRLADPVRRFIERMEAVRGEVLCCRSDEAPAAVTGWLQQAGARRLIAGQDARLDRLLQALSGSFECLRFDRDFEDVSDLMFESVDAGISHCDAGVAETGSLVLASSATRPRSVSLIPPLHVALLPQELLLDDLSSLMAGWSDRPPPNRILISGPSKSADIEQVLAYGVHGPKRLLTVILD